VTELLVQFRPDVPLARRQALAQQLGCTIVEEIPPQGITVVRAPADATLSTLLAQWHRHPEVAHAEPNAEVNPHG